MKHSALQREKKGRGGSSPAKRFWFFSLWYNLTMQLRETVHFQVGENFLFE